MMCICLKFNFNEHFFELLWLMLIQNKISLKNYIKIWLNFFFLDCLKTLIVFQQNIMG